MRKVHFIILCIAIGLVGCSNSHEPQIVNPPYFGSSQTSEIEIEDDASEASNSVSEEYRDKADGQDTNKLSLVTPMIFSEYEFSNDFPKHTGKTLVLELLDGSYDRSMYTWNRMWSGNFHFRLTNKHHPFEPFPDQETDDIVSFPIRLSFNEPFALSVDDYNGDGKPDFAISQYGSMSGGDYCSIFTLNDNGTVEILPIDAGVDRYISAFGTIGESSETGAQVSETFLFPFIHTSNSPLLTKNERNGFSVTYPARQGLDVAFLFDEKILQSWFDEHNTYNDSTADVRDIYQWRDSAFVLIRQEILEDDGTVWKASTDDFVDK